MTADRRSKKRRLCDSWFKLLFGYYYLCKCKFKKNEFRKTLNNGMQICLKCFNDKK